MSCWTPYSTHRAKQTAMNRYYRNATAESCVDIAVTIDGAVTLATLN
jgi:hypothetical protein